MSSYQHILCAVDLGGENLAVASRAAELAKHYGAKLSLLHVVEYIPIDLANELVLPQQQEIEDQLVEQSKKAVTSLASHLNLKQVFEHVVSGSTKAEIIEFTKALAIRLQQSCISLQRILTLQRELVVIDLRGGEHPLGQDLVHQLVGARLQHSHQVVELLLRGPVE